MQKRRFILISGIGVTYGQKNKIEEGFLNIYLKQIKNEAAITSDNKVSVLT